MFEHLRIRGGAATVLYGHRPAAVLRNWTIHKHEGLWFLTATLVRAEPFMCRKRDLLFTAPHEKGRDGWWAWGIERLELGPTTLRAQLGPPEQ